MQLRIYILLLFLIADTISMAQVLFIDDTLKIGEVMVKPSLPEGAAGYKQLKIESELLQNIAGESIAYLLRNNSSLYIKNYGAGGLATSSFRGMGANHTEILWEGQRINSPMLGTTDFATIPTFFIDRVDVFYGGNPGLFGNRGPGGAISFASEVDWKERFKVAYMQDIGSFSTYCEGLKLSLGSVNFQYRLKAYNRSAANDFKYFDYTSGEEIELYRSNSEEKSQGVLQEIYLKSKESIVSAKIWYSGTDRHLPGSIYVSQTEGNETQYDESLRGIVKYQLYKDNFSLEANTVYFSDWL
ncbi:MAG: TonB-dependent receptor plug domain-containing protein, partial [Bacteroidales bacterium]|nr:TonB-dependent receptor plug domain-containing protein [Bacteroidales bacterium]